MTTATMPARYIGLDESFDPDESVNQSLLSSSGRRNMQRLPAIWSNLSAGCSTTTDQQFRELFSPRQETQPTAEDVVQDSESDRSVPSRSGRQRVIRVRVVRRQKWTPNPLPDEHGV